MLGVSSRLLKSTNTNTPMKTIALTTLSLILGATVFAEPPQVEISARYEGFDRSRYAELASPNKEDKTSNVLSAPRITTKQGMRCQIECAEVPVPKTPDGKKTVIAGFALDFLPVVKDGKITLSGKSVLRRRLAQDAVQPLGAISFATNETFFNGVVQDGEELTLEVGDGPGDKSRIVLIVRLVAAPSAKAGSPKLQIIRLDCSAAELLAFQKDAFPDVARQTLRAEYFRSNPISPAFAAAYTPSGIKALMATLDKKAIPVTARDAGFTISAVQNTQAVDLKITHDKHSAAVTVDHGNTVLIGVPDKQSPDGFHLYLIRTE